MINLFVEKMIWPIARVRSGVFKPRNTTDLYQIIKDRLGTDSCPGDVIAQYIEAFYSRQRLHRALGYRRPEEFELQEGGA